MSGDVAARYLQYCNVHKARLRPSHALHCHAYLVAKHHLQWQCWVQSCAFQHMPSLLLTIADPLVSVQSHALLAPSAHVIMRVVLAE